MSHNTCNSAAAATFGRSLLRVFVLPTNLVGTLAVFVHNLARGLLDATLPFLAVQRLVWTDAADLEFYAAANLAAGLIRMIFGGCARQSPRFTPEHRHRLAPARWRIGGDGAGAGFVASSGDDVRVTSWDIASSIRLITITFFAVLDGRVLAPHRSDAVLPLHGDCEHGSVDRFHAPRPARSIVRLLRSSAHGPRLDDDRECVATVLGRRTPSHPRGEIQRRHRLRGAVTRSSPFDTSSWAPHDAPRFHHPGKSAADPDRLARFTREAQVLASLNTTNIAAIDGFEDSGDVHRLALELGVPRRAQE